MNPAIWFVVGMLLLFIGWRIDVAQSLVHRFWEWFALVLTILGFLSLVVGAAAGVNTPLCGA